MPNPIITIHNIETDEVIEREMTAEEFAQYQEEKAKDKADSDLLNKAKADKALLLTKLGITADEAKLLLS
jgi:hypothetical protein